MEDGFAVKPKMHYTRFRRRGSCQLVTDLLEQRDTTDTTDFSHANLFADLYCCGLVVYVADLLRTCYGETGVMDFGRNCRNDRYSVFRIVRKSVCYKISA